MHWSQTESSKWSTDVPSNLRHPPLVSCPITRSPCRRPAPEHPGAFSRHGLPSPRSLLVSISTFATATCMLYNTNRLTAMCQLSHGYGPFDFLTDFRTATRLQPNSTNSRTTTHRLYISRHRHANAAVEQPVQCIHALPHVVARLGEREDRQEASSGGVKVCACWKAWELLVRTLSFVLGMPRNCSNPAHID